MPIEPFWHSTDNGKHPRNADGAAPAVRGCRFFRYTFTVDAFGVPACLGKIISISYVLPSSASVM